jgi:hypothetical protein
VNAPHDGGCIEECIALLTGCSKSDIPDLWGCAEYEWLRIWARWARQRGLVLHRWSHLPPGFAIIIGDSPRSGRHAVLVQDGRLVHDPHPSCHGVRPPFVAYWYTE